MTRLGDVLSHANRLRAASLGANDGILSTAALLVGVGATSMPKEHMVIAGLAGAAGGALSMALGEFVSVKAQRDLKRTESKRAPDDISAQSKRGLHDLTERLRARGSSRDLAK